MAEPRTVKYFFKLEGWKRNKKKLLALFLMCFAVLASALEEGDDNSVNVISVENLDALLGLRMVTELNSKNLSAPEQRTRRASTESLCRRRDCDCDSNGRTVSCSFGQQQNEQEVEVLDLGHGSLPWNAHRVTISNLTELRIRPGAFQNNPSLSHLVLENIGNVTVGKDVFRRSSGGHRVDLQVSNCGSVTLHEKSFRHVGGFLRATIDDCGSVLLKKSFTPLSLTLQVSNVPELELESYAFYAESWGDVSRPTVDLSFHNVTVRVLPSWAFKLSCARIAFVRSVIEIVDTEAFRALQLESVHFVDTAVRRFEPEAFSTQTSIKDVQLNGVNVQYVAGQTLTAATNLTIRNSRIKEISEGAFNATVAFFRLTGNVFRKIGRHAFALQNWNSIVIAGNEFESLKQDTFLAPYTKVENVPNEFVFSDNLINATEVNALSFVPDDPDLDTDISNNTFQELCHCHLESWLSTLSTQKWTSFYDTSSCRISEFGLCYNLEGDFMGMRNYTALVCGSPVQPNCTTRRVGEYEFPTELDLRTTERTIFGVIFLGVASSVAIMLFILSFSWLRQKGVCSAVRRHLTPSGPCCFAVSRLCNTTNLVTSSSISRINIHEYAEIQYQMTEQQKQTILTMNAGLEEEVIVICEDKATQTLPEELTQELLQTLREKLDDPENYNEARNMIEHLYDLIKVEESCNNNNNASRTSLLLDDEEDEEEQQTEVGGNLYDVIMRKPRKTSKKVRKVPAANVRTTGTRAPSPDKLSPVAFNLPPRATIVTEYAEPRDRKSNEYCELPAREGVMPDVLGSSDHPRPEYSPPGRGMENRPLPSRPGTSDDG